MSKELEALENIKRDLEYITRLDYVEPIVRGEVRDNLFKIYHRELPELDIIENALKNYEELSQLKDIEERYGIKILTICKAMIDGCYYLYDGKIEHFIPDGNIFICPNFDNKSMDLMYASPYENTHYVGDCLLFESYGVVWALTREELL